LCRASDRTLPSIIASASAASPSQQTSCSTAKEDNHNKEGADQQESQITCNGFPGPIRSASFTTAQTQTLFWRNYVRRAPASSKNKVFCERFTSQGIAHLEEALAKKHEY
jgi:hypothetical protein